MTVHAQRWSPLLLVALLSPALLQIECNTNGNANLTSLEVEAAGLDRVVGFSASVPSYDVWTPSGVDTITVRAQTAVPSARVNYRLTAGDITSGFIGIGGGEVVLTIPIDTSAQLTLDVSDGGTRRTYNLDLNPNCIPGVCNDADPCSLDTCNSGTNTCEFVAAPDGTACDFASIGDGVCAAGVCEIGSALCDDTTPLAVGDLVSLGSSFPSAYQSRGGTAVASTYSNSLLDHDPDTLARTPLSRTLTDDVVAVSYSGPGHPAWIFASQDNARFVAIDTTTFEKVWERNIARGGCAEDSVSSGPAAYHPRTAGTAAFEAAHGKDLVYAATAFGASSGCIAGHTTDNRIFAYDAETGDIEWRFNFGASVELDSVVGLALDPKTDRLFAATRRESPSADSVWGVNVLTGSRVWSTNAGDVRTPPALFEGRIYVADTSATFTALDAATGAVIWSLRDTSIPVNDGKELSVTSLPGGTTLIATANVFGEILALEDLGASAQTIGWFQLPDGAPGLSTLPPAVQATSRIIADATGRALVGADDGNVYPLNLLTGTVSPPLNVDAPTAAVNSLVLEPPGFYGSPSSFLAGTTEANLKRYCTTLIRPGGCDNGFDDDGDGLADSADPGCNDADDADETTPLLVCDDGLDNDGDGAVDSGDIGCVGPTDTDEGDAFCGSRTSIVSANFGSGTLSRVVPSPDLSKVAFGALTTLYARDAVTLAAEGSTNVGGLVSRSPVWVTRSDGDLELFTTADIGSAFRIDTFGGSLSTQWESTVQRSDCIADSANGPPAVHIRQNASAAFKAEYDTDVVYLGTRYNPLTTSGGSCGGWDVDNRVHALNAETGSNLWTFNDLGGFDLDLVAGMALDADTDTLFITAERTGSVSQDSVWALDVVNGGAVRWSANYGRIQAAPILHEGRLYVASLTGDIIAIDPTDGSEIWRDGNLLPLNQDPVLANLDTGETLIVSVGAFGSIRVVRDDGSSGTTAAWFQLPDGAAGGSLPAVMATSLVAIDPDGRALVGANDGHVYPVDLLDQTVDTPLPVGSASTSIVDVRLEPPGLFATPASFLATTDEGDLARFCTTIGTSP